jgi:hypothetical protein
MRNRSRQGRGDWHQRAAEFHDLAAHAHRVAATHHTQGDFQTGHELSRQAMEYSAMAFRYSQEAHQKSGGSPSGTEKTPVAETAKQADSGSNGSKKKK